MTPHRITMKVERFYRILLLKHIIEIRRNKTNKYFEMKILQFVFVATANIITTLGIC